MVYETEEIPDSYLERSSLVIFGMIQIHVGDSLRSINLLEHEEGTRRKLQRICSQMEECDIVGLTTHHQLRGKSYIRGHFALFVL